MWLKRLSAPIAYLGIRHPAKRKYDFWIPFVVAAVITAGILYAPAPIAILGKDGLISAVGGLLQVLVGFYIAALGAIATFDRPTMDRQMVGEPPVLFQNGVPEKLTRRRFLCLMFGYLSFLSLSLYLAGIAANAAAPSIRDTLAPEALVYLRLVTAFAFFFSFANLVTTTLLGLDYLADRIHRYEPELFLGPAPESDDAPGGHRRRASR